MRSIVNKAGPLMILLLIFLSLMHCEKQPEEESLFYDSDLHGLQILPDNPDRNDQILVVETICGNESDVILEIQGNQIKYLRYFNSLMMMPCSPSPDTTVIGQLATGQYQLIQCMIDKNHLIQDSIAYLDTIPLVVR